MRRAGMTNEGGRIVARNVYYEMKRMIKFIPAISQSLRVFTWSLVCALALAPTVIASGSISAGNSGSVSQFGNFYKQGKIAFFKKVACSRADCPVKRNQVNGSLAGSLVESLRTRAELKLEASETDAIISVLCPGENAGDCAGRPDEQEMVQYYLTRRFNINS